MAQEIQNLSNTSVTIGDDDIVTPLSSWVLFWRPRYQRVPSELVNVPFFFWLTYTLRPRLIATIGDTHGTTHFALCQAVERLDLDARCMACGPWDLEGIGHIPESLTDYNETTYPDISRMTAQSPRAALRRYPEGSVDLVVMPHSALDDAAEHDVGLDPTMLGRLSARGTLVVTGVNPEMEEPEPGSVLDHLMQTYPHFHLENGNGLLVVLVGAQPDERLRRLCEMRLGMPGFAALTQLFSRLGSGLQSEASAQDNARRLRQMAQDVEAMKRRLQEAEAEHAALKAALGTAPLPSDDLSAPSSHPLDDDMLEILTETFERQQIASDAQLEDLRLARDQALRERDALERLLRDNGVDAAPALAQVRARAISEGASSNLAQRLQAQRDTLATLRANLSAAQGA